MQTLVSMQAGKTKLSNHQVVSSLAIEGNDKRSGAPGNMTNKTTKLAMSDLRVIYLFVMEGLSILKAAQFRNDTPGVVFCRKSRTSCFIEEHSYK